MSKIAIGIDIGGGSVKLGLVTTAGRVLTLKFFPTSSAKGRERMMDVLVGHILDWMRTAKKKGFKDGYMIFERGSGRGGRGATHMEVLEDSVQAVRLIAQFLEKDIDPKNLPLEFYGISEKNKELANNRIQKQELKNKISVLRDPALLAELAAFEEKRNQIGVIQEALKEGKLIAG